MKRLIRCNHEGYDRRRIDDYMQNHQMYPQYYRTIHGIGPGTIPSDVHIVDHYEGRYDDYVAFDRELSRDEMRQYDLRFVDADELAKLGIGPYAD